MRKIFKLKDSILKVLSDYDEKFPIGEVAVNKLLHFDEIHKSLNTYSKKTLLNVLHTMQSEGEIYCTLKLDNSDFYILEPGRKKFIEETYLIEGAKESRDTFYDKLKIPTMIILLLVSIITLAISVASNNQNTKRIEKIENKLQKINL